MDERQRELENLKHDIKIAEHNVWVAKTNLEDHESELKRLKKKYIDLQGQENTQGLVRKDLLLE